MKSRLEGGRLDVLAGTETLISFTFSGFTQANQGEIRTIGELMDFSKAGTASDYAAYAKDGSLLFIGPAAELGFENPLNEGDRVIIEQFTYRVPHE